MAKTVKELIEDRILYIKKYYLSNNSIENKILLLTNILQAHENEISNAITNEQMISDFLRGKIEEKDKEINFFQQQLKLAYNLNKNLRKELDEKDSRYFQLKSYFDNLKDNADYKKLESKEVK